MTKTLNISHEAKHEKDEEEREREGKEKKRGEERERREERREEEGDKREGEERERGRRGGRRRREEKEGGKKVETLIIEYQSTHQATGYHNTSPTIHNTPIPPILPPSLHVQYKEASHFSLATSKESYKTI